MICYGWASVGYGNCLSPKTFPLTVGALFHLSFFPCVGFYWVVLRFGEVRFLFFPKILEHTADGINFGNAVWMKQLHHLPNILERIWHTHTKQVFDFAMVDVCVSIFLEGFVFFA